MNFITRFIPVLPLLAAAALAQQPIEVEIVGAAANHELSWTTSLNFNYQVQASHNLAAWWDTGITEPGTGSTITYGFMSTADKMFYRIKETADPYNGGFLILPTHNQELDLVDGVVFAFNLDALSTVPAKIRICQREYESGDPWEQIGDITEFAERLGVEFVRGSVVWIPSAEGDYEVQAVAIDGTGTTMASAVRRVLVGANHPPVITITSGPPTPSSIPWPAVFQTNVTDPDGDTITRVEFYDNGVLIGTDWEAPFGDSIQDLEGMTYDLLRGIHQITAKAYDSRGAIGETASPFVVNITGGNARPTLDVTSPAGSLIVQEGQNITIDYIVADHDGISDIDEVTATNRHANTVWDNTPPFTSLIMDTTGWTPGSHTIIVRARDWQGAYSYPKTFTVFVQAAAGQTLAEKLVANIIDGVSVAASNAIYEGAEGAAGEFDDGLASGLQMDEGILLSTGLFSTWNGGNNDPFTREKTTHEWFRPGDDRLRDRLSGGNHGYVTNDAAALGFDLFCENGQLEFEFQFGSEEYLEYVEDFNDGFLILVNDTIVSLLPDGEDIISVDSVHPFVPSHVSKLGLNIPAKNKYLYLDNDDDIKPTVNPSDYYRLVECDGMTVKLRGHVLVEPGQTYRVRMVIADAKDWAYDAAILFEKNSVKTIQPEL